MTKRLSEIGCERWADEEWREWSSFDLTTQEKWGNPEKLILLTPDQRRELVERAIVSFITQEMESRTNLYILQTRLPAFIKEQGL